MDRQVLIDRLLETENLTDNLEDEHAKILMKWGVGQVDHLVGGIEDEEAAGEKVNQLMQLMREINTIAGNPSTVSEEKFARLIDSFKQTFEINRPIDIDSYKDVAEKLSAMQPGEAVKFLLEWIKSNQEE